MNLKKMAGLALLSTLVAFHGVPAWADIVTTDQLITQKSSEESDKAKIQEFVDRATVKERISAMGVGSVIAADRIAAMSAQEAHMLAARIDAMPAGGNLSGTDIIIILLVIILVAIIV